MEITLSTRTECRIKVYILLFYQNPTNYRIFGDRSFVCLVSLKFSALRAISHVRSGHSRSRCHDGTGNARDVAGNSLCARTEKKEG